MTTADDLDVVARRTAGLLAARQTTAVFAESCTGGLIAATLTAIPGISSWLCGSAVVYQVETKAEWLGVSRSILDDPGPVSSEVAEAMARGVLERTPHARLAASVTGHLGPNAPPEQDGLLYSAVAIRRQPNDANSSELSMFVREHRLRAGSDGGKVDAVDPLRLQRQREAAAFVLSLVCTVLELDGSGHSDAT